MNLYKVFNGYIGYNYVHSLVVASTEKEAIEMARPLFGAADERENYSKNLTAELVFEDLSIKRVSYPTDC